MITRWWLRLPVELADGPADALPDGFGVDVAARARGGAGASAGTARAATATAAADRAVRTPSLTPLRQDRPGALGQDAPLVGVRQPLPPPRAAATHSTSSTSASASAELAAGGRQQEVVHGLVDPPPVGTNQ